MTTLGLEAGRGVCEVSTCFIIMSTAILQGFAYTGKPILFKSRMAQVGKKKLTVEWMTSFIVGFLSAAVLTLMSLTRGLMVMPWGGGGGGGGGEEGGVNVTGLDWEGLSSQEV